jgi:chemotaxis protein methyltransferase CheR
MDDITYAALKRVIRERLDLDLDAYKAPQMRRRLDTFVATHGGGDNASKWVHALPTDTVALAALREVITINVSEFFRDTVQWETLRSQVLPMLLADRPQLSIWSAACSNGQEPYTLAMLLDELEPAGRSRILATDIDRTVMGRARAGGPYNANDVRGVSPERLAKYFVRSGDSYSIVPKLQSRITIREHNLLATAYGTGFDLIVCRNVLIYFEQDAKLEIVTRFRAALRPGGVLFIGGTEALLGPDAQGYKIIGGNFYQKVEEKAAARRVA